MYTFVCEKCGGTFQSKTDPTTWRKRLCNNCRGNKYATNNQSGGYQPRTVPTAVQTTQSVPTNVVYANTNLAKKEFDLESYITDMFLVYATIKRMADENQMTIPADNICNWTTSIMIEKNKNR